VAGRGSAGLAAVVSLALLAAAPTPAGAVQALAHAPSAEADPLAPLLSLVTLTAWALVGWVLLLLVAAHATRLPGSVGRMAATTLPRIAPVAVRRLLAPMLGVTVGLAVVGAVPAAASPPPPVPTAPVSLDWPTRVAAALDWPVPTPAGAAAPRPAHPAPVVVQPGDSLWAVAADHLPATATNAQIAQAWPRWWSANRAAVGADPDLIHPGLSLTPPTR
jgi:hypothetical protein